LPSKKPRRTARIKPCQVSLVRRKWREERNCYGFKTYLDLARSDQVNTSESTVKRFFAAQERIDADVAKDICRVLKLEPPEEYLEGMGLEAISSSETLENSAQPVFQTYLEQLCREMLVQLQELATNPLTRPGVSLKLDDISVERGLPQLKAKPKCNSDFPTQLIQALAEGDKITSLTHQQFFEFFDRVFRKNFYAFFHSTFLEYLVARAIADDWRFFLNPVPGNPAAGSYRLFDESKWLDAYLVWLGHPAVPSEAKVSLLRALLAFEDECTDFNFYRLRGYFIAAIGLPEFKDCPPSLADEIVGIVVKLAIGFLEGEHQLLIQTYRSIAASARSALFRIDVNRTLDLVIHNLRLIVEDKNYIVREYFQKNIAEILEEIAIGNSKVIQVLSQLLLRNPNKETRRIWVECLKKICLDHSNAIVVFNELFHQISDEYTRFEIAQYLINIDQNNECLIAFLIEQFSFEFYYSLLYILQRARVDNQIITNLLIQNLNNATDDLNRLKFASLISVFKPKEALSYLQGFLDSPEEKIRMEAALSLQDILPNNPQIIQIFNELLNSEDEKIVLMMARSLSLILGNPFQIINILLEMIRGSKNEVRRKDAAVFLLKIAANNKNVTKKIIELLSTRQDEETHRLVAWYLGEIIPASSETIKALIECLSSPISQSVQYQAVASLGQVGEGNGKAVSALISLLQSSIDINLQREIVESLGKIGLNNLNVIRTLEKIIDETKDEETCFLAAFTLSKTKVDKLKGIEALKNLMSSSQSLSLQYRAAMALSQQLPGDINILKTLIELLLDNRGELLSYYLDIHSEGNPFRTRIANFLKNQVFTEQLPLIINTIKSYKFSQDEANFTLYTSFGGDIIWHYTQKLPYDKFYQACRGE
jgi:HEAT repeat protein